MTLGGGGAHPQAGQVAERGGGEARSGTVRSLTRAAVIPLANLESTGVVTKLAQGNQLKSSQTFTTYGQPFNSTGYLTGSLHQSHLYSWLQLQSPLFALSSRIHRPNPACYKHKLSINPTSCSRYRRTIMIGNSCSSHCFHYNWAQQPQPLSAYPTNIGIIEQM